MREVNGVSPKPCLEHKPFLSGESVSWPECRPSGDSNCPTSFSRHFTGRAFLFRGLAAVRSCVRLGSCVPLFRLRPARKNAATFAVPRSALFAHLPRIAPLLLTSLRGTTTECSHSLARPVSCDWKLECSNGSRFTRNFGRRQQKYLANGCSQILLWTLINFLIEVSSTYPCAFLGFYVTATINIRSAPRLLHSNKSSNSQARLCGRVTSPPRKKDHSTVQQDLQNTNGTVSTHHHHRGGAGVSISNNSLLHDFSQVGQDLSSSNLLGAQQAYAATAIPAICALRRALNSESPVSFDA